MLKLHPECHNFAKFSSDRCPFIAVCNEDCVYVWKEYYDSSSHRDYYEDTIEELEEKISDLERENNSLEEDKNIAENEAENWQIKYENMVDELAQVMNEESIDKLSEYQHEGKIGEWADDVCSRRINL